MSKFKAGDWVTCSGYIDKEMPYQILFIEDGLIFYGVNSCFNVRKARKWKPKIGSWVVIFNRANKNVFSVCKYTEEVQSYIDEGWWPTTEIEPFFGDLPSFLEEEENGSNR